MEILVLEAAKAYVGKKYDVGFDFRIAQSRDKGKISATMFLKTYPFELNGSRYTLQLVERDNNVSAILDRYDGKKGVIRFQSVKIL